MGNRNLVIHAMTQNTGKALVPIWAGALLGVDCASKPSLIEV